MSELTIYGRSDDIMLFEGDIDKQIYPPQDCSVLLSDGTLVNATFHNGWRFDVEKTGGSTTFEKYSRGSETAQNIANTDHTDVIKLFGDEFIRAIIVDDVHEVVE